MEEVAARKTESALMEIHYKLQGHGKELVDHLNRLTAIGNRLYDDSGNVKESEDEKKSPDRAPGIITNLTTDCDGLYKLISEIGKQLKKIEPLI